LDIWTFATTVHARPGVDGAFIDLQDRRGLDVTAAVLGMWAGAVCGHRFSEDACATMAATAGRWQAEVVAPLRTVRRRLKTGPAPAPSDATAVLRRAVAEVELAAERLILERLAADGGLVPRAVWEPAAARHNLDLLLRPHLLALPADPADAAAIDTLVTAVAT
jgi:uncharacterized protein (TIGR02444 family)